MLFGIIILSALAVLFFLGKGKIVSGHFGNDFVVLVLILFTIVGNLIPPYIFKNSAFYLGGMFLAIVALLLIFIKLTGSERILTLIGTAVFAVGMYLFLYLLMEPIAASDFVKYFLTVLLGGIAGFILGKSPLSVFIVSYLGFFIASSVHYFMSIADTTGGVITNILGGGVGFSIAVSVMTLAVGINAFVTFLSRKSEAKKYIFDGEASEELSRKDEENDLKNKKSKKNKKL